MQLGDEQGPQRQEIVPDADLVDPGQQLPIRRRQDRRQRLQGEALDRLAPGAPADPRIALQHSDREPAPAQLPGGRQAGHTGAHDGDLLLR